MPWTKNADGSYSRTFTPPERVERGRVEVYLPNGDSVDIPALVNPDGTLTATVPGSLLRVVRDSGGGRVQVSGDTPSGARHYVYGRDVAAAADGTLAEPEPVDPNADVKQALRDATTVAGLKAAVLAYFERLDP